MDELRRSRSTRSHIIDARHVARVVLPRTRVLGELQARAAVLRIEAQGELRHRRPPGQVASEIDELLTRIEIESQSLLSDIEKLSPRLAMHGRVVDTWRPLQTLAGQLQQARALCEMPTD